MKKAIVLFFIIAAICSISCNSTQKATLYSVGLKYVDGPFNIAARHKDIILVEGTNDKSEASYLYEDDLMSIIWNVDTEVFAFALENKSDYPIEIPWDDVVYFDWQGYAHRVIHKDVKYVNKNSPQESTIVPHESAIADYLLPVANIYSTSGLYNSSYTIKNLFPSYKNQNVANKSKLAGQTIKIKFPIVFDGKKKEYLFAFQINDIAVRN